MKANILSEVCQKNCKAACCKFGGADFTRAEMRKVLRAGYPDRFVRLGDNHYEMRSKNGVCPYLRKDNSCSIYDARPLVCKSFPVYVDGSGNFFLVRCKLAPLLSERELSDMKMQAGRAEDIIATTFSDSKLPKSVIRTIEKRFSRFKRKPLHLSEKEGQKR